MQHLVDIPSFCPQPTPELLAFANRRLRNEQLYGGPERRSESRQAIVVPVLVQAVDEQLHPLGDPLAMVTRDLSPKGVSLVHEQRMQHDRIVLRMTVQEEEAILLSTVCWRKPLGPFYLCGCEIIAKLDHFPGLATRIRIPSSATSRVNTHSSRCPA